MAVLSSLGPVLESSGNIGPKVICWVFLSGREKRKKLFAWHALLHWARLLAGRGWETALY